MSNILRYWVIKRNDKYVQIAVKSGAKKCSCPGPWNSIVAFAILAVFNRMRCVETISHLNFSEKHDMKLSAASQALDTIPCKCTRDNFLQYYHKKILWKHFLLQKWTKKSWISSNNQSNWITWQQTHNTSNKKNTHCNQLEIQYFYQCKYKYPIYHNTRF